MRTEEATSIRDLHCLDCSENMTTLTKMTTL